MFSKGLSFLTRAIFPQRCLQCNVVLSILEQSLCQFCLCSAPQLDTIAAQRTMLLSRTLFTDRPHLLPISPLLHGTRSNLLLQPKIREQLPVGCSARSALPLTTHLNDPRGPAPAGGGYCHAGALVATFGARLQSKRSAGPRRTARCSSGWCGCAIFSAAQEDGPP